MHRSNRHHGASAKNERLTTLRKKIILVVLLSLIASMLMAQEPEVTPLMAKDLKDFPGKEGGLAHTADTGAGQTCKNGESLLKLLSANWVMM